jgi:hypothetical protein
MVMRRASPDTDQITRSLLQKAVRRGNPFIAKAAFRYLTKEKSDFPWLRSRLAVMTFEEAWPYGRDVTFGRSESEIADHYTTLCVCEKNKDAAGLGSLAYALSEGDHSVLSGDEHDWYIRVVAKALVEKEKFSQWITSEAKKLSLEQFEIVEHALEGSRKAGWPWDKAFTYAAALLAVKYPVPELNRFEPTDKKFPFWVAIDKHTQRGKEVIRQVAKKQGIPANNALWLSFYCSSSICVNLVESPWWQRERKWRFSKLNMSENQANEVWAELQIDIIQDLQDDANKLEDQIINFMEPRVTPRPTYSVQSETQPQLF